MSIAFRVNACIDFRVNVCVDFRVKVCIDFRVKMCIDFLVDVCIDFRVIPLKSQPRTRKMKNCSWQCITCRVKEETLKFNIQTSLALGYL